MASTNNQILRKLFQDKQVSFVRNNLPLKQLLCGVRHTGISKACLSFSSSNKGEQMFRSFTCVLSASESSVRMSIKYNQFSTALSVPLPSMGMAFRLSDCWGQLKDVGWWRANLLPPFPPYFLLWEFWNSQLLFDSAALPSTICVVVSSALVYLYLQTKSGCKMPRRDFVFS